MARPLGRLQRTALSSLARLNSGTWTPSCGWVIESAPRTVQILDSLVERGHAARASATCRYTITESGLNALGWASCRLCTRLTRLPARPTIAAPGGTTCSWCTATPTDGSARDRVTARTQPVPPVLVRAR
ncbi:hypothetical protein [Streptomyces sp. NBC_01601]|uniref:hypothetical protein n=1 Tax=Streptomyces sp. NBC_01601 TaxID=2975892 RepID=UPI002E2A3F48|nr:hypothetical protein [Streptomyces sp. NBC_01601]